MAGLPKRGAKGTDLGGEFIGPKSVAHFLLKLLQTPKGGKAEDRPDMRRGVGRFVTAGGSVASLRLPPRSVRADDRVVDTRDARRLGRVASVDKAAGTMTVHWDDGSPAERRPIETVHDPIHDQRRSFDAAPVDHPPKLDAAVGGPRRQDTPSGRMHDLVASGAVVGEDRRRALDVARSGELSADQARASMRTPSATPHPPRQTYAAELRAGVVPAHMEPSGSPAAAKVARAKAPAKPSPAKATLSAADREKRTKAMTRRYASGASIDDIAAEHGVSSSTVHTALTNSGVQLRPRGGSARVPAKAADVVPPVRVEANPKRRQLLQRIADEPGSLPTDLRTSPELAELEREGHIRRTYPRASPSASTNQSIGGAHFALTPSGRRELRDLNTHANSAALYAVVDRHDPFSPASAAARVPAKKAAPDLTGANGLSSDPAVREVQVENRIRAAYAEAVAAGDRGYNGHPARDGHDYAAGVRLSSLRERLGESTPRPEVDDALRRMSRQDHVFIGSDENQKTLTAADREASVRIFGQDHNMVTLERQAREPRPLPTPAKKAAAKVASAKAAFSVEDVHARLAAVQSREEGHTVLAGLSMAQLREVSPSAAGGSRGKAELTDKIVAQHVGGRLSFQAMHDTYAQSKLGLDDMPGTRPPTSPAAAAKVAKAAPAKRVAKATAPSEKGRRILGPERAQMAKDLARRYASGASIGELAQSTGRSDSFIHQILVESGIQLRPRGGAMRGRR